VTDEAGVLAQELVFVCFVSLFLSFLGEGCLWQEERYVLLSFSISVGKLFSKQLPGGL